jgi:hypothetical protein
MPSIFAQISVDQRIHHQLAEGPTVGGLGKTQHQDSTNDNIVNNGIHILQTFKWFASNGKIKKKGEIRNESTGNNAEIAQARLQMGSSFDPGSVP